MASWTRGWIFLCNDDTEEECFQRGLMGTTPRHFYHLKALTPGDPVLLYNYQSNRLVGEFTALSEARKDIVPDAWGGKFGAQVTVELKKRFEKPISRKTLEAFPDLNFDTKGHLTNFSVPAETLLEILDIAAGLKKKPGEVADEVELTFRQKFPTSYYGSDGHRVRSKAELLIDNWLYAQRPSLGHAYERRLPVLEEAYCDFYVPLGDCYIEYWGLDTREYKDRRRKKEEIYAKHGFDMISLEDRDIAELDDRLPKRLLEFFPDDFEFR